MSEIERCRETYRGMEVAADGDWVHFEDYESVRKERDDWRQAYTAQQQVVQDIGSNLDAKVPYELVSEVARRRMKELDEVTNERNKLRELLKLTDVPRNKESGL